MYKRSYNKLISITVLFGISLVAMPALAQQRPQAEAAERGVVTPDPTAGIVAAARSLRANDLHGVLSALIPPAQLQVARGAFEIHRNEVISDDERREFEEKFGKFTAPDAVDTLMAEIEPQLVEARPKAPGAILMGLGAMQMAIASPDADLTDEQRAALRLAIPGIERWLNHTDFLSSKSMRQALTLVTDAARGTGIANLDEMREQSFDQLLGHAGSVLSAAKQAIRIYGLDLDAIVDSVYVEVVSVQGDSATVRTTITVFDAPISREIELVLVEGRWYGKDAVANFDFDHSDYSEG